MSIFTNAYLIVDEKTKKDFLRVLQTWHTIFSNDIIRQIEDTIFGKPSQNLIKPSNTETQSVAASQKEKLATLRHAKQLAKVSIRYSYMPTIYFYSYVHIRAAIKSVELIRNLFI